MIPDPYQDWLAGFEREVSQSMKESSPGPAAVTRAVSEFESWWQEANPGTEEDLGREFDPAVTSRETEILIRENRALKADIETLKAAPDAQRAQSLAEEAQKLAQERAALQERVGRLEAENKELTAYRNTIDGQVADLRVRMSRAQDDYEAQIRRLGDHAHHLNEQIRTLTENKRFLQSEFSHQAVRLEKIEADMKSAIDENARLEKEKDALSHKLEELRARLEAKASDSSELEGSIKELRQQTYGLQERLVRSRETMDAELAAREKTLQELALRNQETEERLVRQQHEAEDRIREATSYLESKIREIQDSAASDRGRFREVLDQLARIRENLS
jgi:chromosome segregation ATPase